jgi:hypothetical protein
LQLPTVQAKSNSTAALRWQELSQTVIDNSVQRPTQHQYSSKWQRWIRFTDQYFAGRQHPGEYLQRSNTEDRAACVQSFLACLYFDDGVAPSTINNYLSAIRSRFQRDKQNSECLQGDNIARFMRGIQLQDAALGVQHDKKRPIPLSMIQSLISIDLQQHNLIDSSYRIAVLMAYFFLLRQSEYIYSVAEGNHAIRVNDVEFRLKDSEVLIPSHQLRDSSYRDHDIDLVKVTLRHCKNDPFRQGNAFWRARTAPVPGQIDLISEMVQFSLAANSVDGDVYMVNVDMVQNFFQFLMDESWLSLKQQLLGTVFNLIFLVHTPSVSPELLR